MRLDLTKSIICYTSNNNKSNVKYIALVEMPEEIRTNNCLYGYLFVMKNGYCRLDYNNTVYDNSLNPNRLSKWYHQALLMKVTEQSTYNVKLIMWKCEGSDSSLSDYDIVRAHNMCLDFLSLTGEGYIPSMYKKYGKVVSLMGKSIAHIKPCEPANAGCVLSAQQLQEMVTNRYANRGSLLQYIVNVEKNMRGYFEIKNELTGRSIVYDCDKYILETETEERYVYGYKGNVKLYSYPASAKVIIKDVGGNIVDIYTADTTSAYAIIIHT